DGRDLIGLFDRRIAFALLLLSPGQGRRNALVAHGLLGVGENGGEGDRGDSESCQARNDEGHAFPPWLLVPAEKKDGPPPSTFAQGRSRRGDPPSRPCDDGDRSARSHGLRSKLQLGAQGSR